MNEQLRLFEAEKITLSDFKEFLMRVGEGFGNTRYVKGVWIHKSYVLGLYAGYGRKEKDGIVDYSAIFDFDKSGKGKLAQLGLSTLCLWGDDKNTEFFRKLDRTGAWKRFVIDMEEIGNGNHEKQ